MHILHVTPYFPPTWAYGGIPRIVDGLARAQRDLGAKVTVLTTDAFDSNRRADVEPVRMHQGVRVITVRNVSNRMAARHQLFLPRGVHGALRDMREPIDVVHLHGHRHLLNNHAVRWAALCEIPYVLTANGTLLRQERKVGLKWLWDMVLAGHVPKGAERCISVSAADTARHHQAGIDVDRVVRIPNGIDLEEFEALPAKGQFRARHAIGPGPIVTYLGRISPRKGVEHLVAAFAGFDSNDAAFAPTLVIAGAAVAGKQTAALTNALRQAGQNVRQVGLVAGQERLELLSDTDVLVYPSAHEVFGLVPFEGLLCGAPAVVADDCGCGELVREAGAGLLVQYGDVEGLSARIRTLLLDRTTADAMVARGRKFVQANLGMQAVARAHLHLYEQVMEEWR